jgi:hypothetical protein
MMILDVPGRNYALRPARAINSRKSSVNGLTPAITVNRRKRVSGICIATGGSKK